MNYWCQQLAYGAPLTPLYERLRFSFSFTFVPLIRKMFSGEKKKDETIALTTTAAHICGADTPQPANLGDFPSFGGFFKAKKTGERRSEGRKGHERQFNSAFLHPLCPVSPSLSTSKLSFPLMEKPHAAHCSCSRRRVGLGERCERFIVLHMYINPEPGSYMLCIHPKPCWHFNLHRGWMRTMGHLCVRCVWVGGF